jgi:dihydroorotase
MTATTKSPILLKGGRVLNPATQLDAVTDVLMENGTITAIGDNLTGPDGCQVEQLTPDHWVAPGLVDLHVHFRDPGRSDKETTATGSAAAIAGGFTTVCTMPNTNPVLDNTQTMLYVLDAAKQNSPITIHPIAGATKGLEGKELTPMGTLASLGAVGFSDDGNCLMNAQIMRLALEYARMFDMPFICHAEDTNLSKNGCMNEGYYSTLLGLPGYPNIAESVIVSRDIELSRVTGGHVHFAHVSTREAVELIRKAKAEGLRITAEVTPHHLTLTDYNCVGYNGNFKMNPPLRSKEDRAALIEALQDGTFDAVATDHAPHTPDEKTMAFDGCPNGVIGLETALGVMLTRFVHTQKLTPLQLIDRMSTGPSRALKLPSGQLQPGGRADVVVIDPNAAWTVDPTQFKSKSRNTPFSGWNLQGKAVKVYSGGQSVL